MPRPTPAVDGASSEAITDSPRSLREYIKNTVINTVPPLVGYYGLRLFDVAPYLALVGAIVVATMQGLLTMVRKRKFEPVNGLVIAGAACSLTIAFVTKNPRIVQVIELVPVSLLVWSLAASGLLRRPTSIKIASAIVPGLAAQALPERGWTPQFIEDWHGLHTRLCAGLGLLCGLFPLLATVWIFTLSVDVSQILIVAIGPTLLVLSIAGAIALLRRFVQRRDQIAAERAARPAGANPEPSG
ncbi:VC0807 family protein [Mycobacterium avium]|uniref:VC0807 family protein n=1 Tax=Mycobacterium avium TaxID=1764 RepID=UPI000CE47479|nr:VC0807 family protein [Mycobacterium avium]